MPVELSFRPVVRRHRDGGLTLALDTVAAGTIAEVLGQTRALLLDRDAPDIDLVRLPDDAPPGQAGQTASGSDAVDPFDAIVADFDDAASAQAPADPVLRRLLPDGLTGDQEAAAEFRAATERSLRRRKIEALDGVLGDLQQLRDGAEKVHVPRPRVHLWLVGLNDARLALGAMLDIRSDTDLQAELDEYLDDQIEEVDLSSSAEDERTLRAYRILVYDILSDLQARMVAALP